MRGLTAAVLATAAVARSLASARRGVPDPPDVLAEQHGAELLEPRRWVVERTDDRLALGDRERQHLRRSAVGGFEPGAEAVVVDQAGKLGH